MKNLETVEGVVISASGGAYYAHCKSIPKDVIIDQSYCPPNVSILGKWVEIVTDDTLHARNVVKTLPSRYESRIIERNAEIRVEIQHDGCFQNEYQMFTHDYFGFIADIHHVIEPFKRFGYYNVWIKSQRQPLVNSRWVICKYQDTSGNRAPPPFAYRYNTGRQLNNSLTAYKNSFNRQRTSSREFVCNSGRGMRNEKQLFTRNPSQDIDNYQSEDVLRLSLERSNTSSGHRGCRNSVSPNKYNHDESRKSISAFPATSRAPTTNFSDSDDDLTYSQNTTFPKAINNQSQDINKHQSKDFLPGSLERNNASSDHRGCQNSVLPNNYNHYVIRGSISAFSATPRAPTTNSYDSNDDLTYSQNTTFPKAINNQSQDINKHQSEDFLPRSLERNNASSGHRMCQNGVSPNKSTSRAPTTNSSDSDDDLTYSQNTTFPKVFGTLSTSSSGSGMQCTSEMRRNGFSLNGMKENSSQNITCSCKISPYTQHANLFETVEPVPSRLSNHPRTAEEKEIIKLRTQLIRIKELVLSLTANNQVSFEMKLADVEEYEELLDLVKR